MKHMYEYTHWLYFQETYIVHKHVNKFWYNTLKEWRFRESLLL